MPARVIIVESDLFVSEDLSQILRDTLDRAVVIAVPDLAQAISEMRPGRHVDLIFLNGSAAQTDDPEFLDLVNRTGARLVRIGGQAGGAGRHEICIPAPFTNDAIDAILKAWKSDQA